MNAGRSRASTLVMSSMQLKFCIDAPSNVRYNELINYHVGTTGRDIIYYLLIIIYYYLLIIIYYYLLIIIY